MGLEKLAASARIARSVQPRATPELSPDPTLPTGMHCKKSLAAIRLWMTVLYIQCVQSGRHRILQHEGTEVVWILGVFSFHDRGVHGQERDFGSHDTPHRCLGIWLPNLDMKLLMHDQHRIFSPAQSIAASLA